MRAEENRQPSCLIFKFDICALIICRNVTRDYLFYWLIVTPFPAFQSSTIHAAHFFSKFIFYN